MFSNQGLRQTGYLLLQRLTHRNSSRYRTCIQGYLSYQGRCFTYGLGRNKLSKLQVFLKGCLHSCLTSTAKIPNADFIN